MPSSPWLLGTKYPWLGYTKPGIKPTTYQCQGGHWDGSTTGAQRLSLSLGKPPSWSEVSSLPSKYGDIWATLSHSIHQHHIASQTVQELTKQTAVSSRACLEIARRSYRHKEATHTIEPRYDLSTGIPTEDGSACVLSLHLFWLGLQIQYNNFNFIKFVDLFFKHLTGYLKKINK